MADGSILEQLADSLADLPHDMLESALDVLAEFGDELKYLSHDDVVKIVGMAVSAAAGAGVRYYLEQNREKLDAAIRRGLAT